MHTKNWPSVPRNNRRKPRRAGERAEVRVVILAVIFLVIGFAAGAFWYRHVESTRVADAENAGAEIQPGALSDATKSVLQRLQDPVQVRYYSLLDPAGASDSLKAFAGRVDQLLSAYEQASGNIKVDRHSSQADDSKAAFADGLQAFNLDKGDACYLGMVVTMGARKEVLPRLSPDWEQAVEPDLTRAIARLLDQPATGSATPTAAPVDTKAIAEVKTLIPDIANVSVEDGSKTLRAAALKDFAAAANDMASQISDAQQKLSEAQNGGSDADQQAAMKNLQELQAAQSAKLREITARTAAQIEALKQIKSQPGGQ